jgi:hypothetical protein
MSISGRINAFISDLNIPSGNRGVVDNFHPNMTGRSTWNSEVQWSTTPLAQSATSPYSISMVGSPADIGSGYMSQSGTIFISGGTPASRSIYFEFLEDGANNWKIYYISLSGGAFEWGTP